jgi:MFS transporter, DHA2 family, methylenomycin A resistance protein
MTTTAPPPAVRTPLIDRRRAALGAAMLGFFVVSLDAQIVNVALPDVGAALHGGLTGLQWVIAGYTLTFSSLILLAGTLSDRIGARRAYAVGMVVFALASACCGMAPSLGTLVGARVVQGAGAALVTPTSLALIREAFDDPRQRARAIGSWAVAGSVAAAAGPILGGLLTTLDWRLIFLVNLPVAAVALVWVGRAARSASRAVPFDVGGQASAIVAVASLSYVVIEGGGHGWTRPSILVLLTVAILAGIAFVRTQRRGRHPMLPLRLFRSRQVSVALCVAFTTVGAFYSVVFVQGLYFQEQRGVSSLTAGLLFLPMMVAVTLVNSRAAALAIRYDRSRLITAGAALQAVGLSVIALLPSGTPVGATAASMVLVGAGGALTVAPIASLLIDLAPDGLAGTTSGVLNTVRQLGASLGVAAVGATIASSTTFMGGVRTGLAGTVVLLAGTALLSLRLRAGPQ